MFLLSIACKEHDIEIDPNEVNVNSESCINAFTLLKESKSVDHNTTSKVSKNDERDMRLKCYERYEKQFPEFYYSHSLHGWFCKICPNFSSGSGSRAFVSIPGGFGDHPTLRANLHLNSSRHQLAVKNKQAFDSLRFSF